MTAAQTEFRARGLNRIRMPWFLALFLLCASLAAVAWWWSFERQQEYEARKILVKRGVYVETAPMGNEWLRARLGKKYLQKAVKVSFLAARATPADLAVVAQLKETEDLNLFGSDKVEDDSLQSLAGLQKLQSLNLTRTNVKGAGILALKSLPDLRELRFGAVATDEAVVHLSQLPRVERLYFMNSRITDNGLKQFARLPKLRRLEFVNTGQFSETGLEQLRRDLPHVEIVYTNQ